MKALIFPGQGSQVVGMGLEFYKNFDFVKKIFHQADDVLKFNLSKIILEGPDEKLKLTENAQPAILTISYSIFRVLKEELEIKPSSFQFFAGHSLGEYSALVCSESLNYVDAIYLLNERGKAMQEAVPIGKGKMIAVLGLNTLEIKNEIENNKRITGICEIANDNADGQIIVSGETNSIDLFQELLKEKKIKTIPLKVSAPFHCTLMKPAADKMKDKINNTKFIYPTTKVFNNVNANVDNDPSSIKKLLIEQIYSTVRWRDILINMSKLGINNYLEIGPGKALSGMVKRTIKNVNSFSINSLDDIKNLKNEIK